MQGKELGERVSRGVQRGRFSPKQNLGLNDPCAPAKEDSKIGKYEIEKKNIPNSSVVEQVLWQRHPTPLSRICCLPSVHWQ